ncbi:hypothetical protein [Micromonospora craniellae]|uniref:Uncharacterized protein n=1 Tax=Micromonospora craniellae TaxID=2294034 RepID=A0A372G0D1_9ACTN|nr:hypothetical protein [Micromonospora craniellae]QOC94644.1 hypothetical protein ID554_14475 [Micromonospora craniellae]RFS46433.1 hypothetical protein D0Q02_11770 [Micromonospora craniellae]
MTDAARKVAEQAERRLDRLSENVQRRFDRITKGRFADQIRSGRFSGQGARSTGPAPSGGRSAGPGQGRAGHGAGRVRTDQHRREHGGPPR